jgi:LysM repeat protein
MTVRIRFLLPLFVFLAVGGFAQEAVHIIQKGETLYSIARNYGANIQDILRLNGIQDPGRVQAGQRLKIPAAVYVEYRAVRGDSLFGIARKNGITLQELRAANNLRENYVLKAGDRLKIPRRAAVAVNPPAKPESAVAAGTGAPADTPAASANAPETAVWPVQVKELAYMTGKLYGVALLGERSEAVKSLTQGTVGSAGPYRGFGKVVIVQMTGG